MQMTSPPWTVASSSVALKWSSVATLRWLVEGFDTRAVVKRTIKPLNKLRPVVGGDTASSLGRPNRISRHRSFPWGLRNKGRPCNGATSPITFEEKQRTCVSSSINDEIGAKPAVNVLTTYPSKPHDIMNRLSWMTTKNEYHNLFEICHSMWQ